MTESRAQQGSTAIPCLHYQDAKAAITWLCVAFGLEKGLVVPGENDTIAHAELTLGAGMVMVGSKSDTAYGGLMRLPKETGGGQTQSIYLVVPDVDHVYRTAMAAGAEVVLEPKDEEYGGRSFSCYDLEGHLWTIGSYNPWKR
ncbi:VOC family protein [Cupriavidus sp. AU9028]|uniref:VOC family protein n=1 Tax=Cupriavidus sp. AU9028 TaxID=2871157 RepID=UPI001C94058E|nr:VOC family protein [Cupriavidus sp. AU9028]MBY4897906.1 VOC family protein [Cupriavidus sp. AU9028]